VPLLLACVGKVCAIRHSMTVRISTTFKTKQILKIHVFINPPSQVVRLCFQRAASLAQKPTLARALLCGCGPALRFEDATRNRFSPQQGRGTMAKDKPVVMTAFCCLIVTAWFLGIFFGVNYPEIRKNTVFQRTSCRTISSEIKPYRACSKGCTSCSSCNGCNTCKSMLAIHASRSKYDNSTAGVRLRFDGARASAPRHIFGCRSCFASRVWRCGCCAFLPA